MRTDATLRRSGRIAATVAVAGALVAPVVFDHDSFPLSIYPMYARSRTAQSTIVTAQGIDADDTVIELTPTLIGNSDDPLIVVGELRAALSGGRGDQRCDAIAERVGRRAELGHVSAVEIVSERHDTVARTSGNPSLIERTVRVRCDVVRT